MSRSKSPSEIQQLKGFFFHQSLISFIVNKTLLVIVQILSQANNNIQFSHILFFQCMYDLVSDFIYNRFLLKCVKHDIELLQGKFASRLFCTILTAVVLYRKIPTYPPFQEQKGTTGC